MTLIEIFDRTPVENIISTLAVKPDRVIFVGPDSKKARRAIPAYRQILENRGIRSEMSVHGVAKNDLEGILEELNKIFADPDEKNFIIDISGGDEGSLVAVGMILGGHAKPAGKRICAFRINPVSRHATLFELKHTDGGISVERTICDFSAGTQVYLTVEEDVILHGGKVLDRGLKFERGDAVEEDIDVMWTLCWTKCKNWNVEIGRISAAISRYTDDGDVYIISDEAFKKGRNQVDRALFDRFIEDGLILPVKKDGDLLSFRFKNRIVKECLTKAGSLLEYYTYKTALSVKRDNAYLYDDAEVGVVICWDDDVEGTRNEIDCMVTSGVIPVFISCKNGNIETDELYKLNSVADRFGHEYAKTALASTVFFDEDDPSYDGDMAANNLKNRADDMGIRMLSTLHKVPVERFMKQLSGLVG
ncbi:MAG: DUF1887 family protein [Clostridia bacterium]|nr:DUF1887 family protein [Clostridia bacterium]MBQ8511607.1 DUF1887 family protein [Clostridia bacterium]